MHKEHYSSSVYFTACDLVSSIKGYLSMTEDDDKVTCTKCLDRIKKLKELKEQ